MVAAHMGRKNDAKYNICATGVHLREIINGLFFSFSCKCKSVEHLFSAF